MRSSVFRTDQRTSFGPNTFPANNSALYACEVQVDYAAKALFQPLLDKRAKTIEVKESVENRTTNEIHLRLRNSVFSGKCTNWYIGDFGRNAASWPGLAIEFWFATMCPDWSAFNMDGGSSLWFLNTIYRWIRPSMSGISIVVLGGALVAGLKSGAFSRVLQVLSHGLKF